MDNVRFAFLMNYIENSLPAEIDNVLNESNNIQTLLYHGLMTLYGVLTLAYGNEKLQWKNCWKELIVIVLMTLWALLGNFIYNSDVRVYNWFFVIRDPFYILPIDISKYIMPFIMIIIVFIN